MSTQHEQENFSSRLRESMAARGYPTHSPTTLSREFNLRHPGRAISVHAARKWLLGEAIPTQEKLLVLSKWLQVKPEWLRFDGDATASDGKGEPAAQLSPDALRLLTDYHALDERYRRVLRDVADSLVKAQLEKLLPKKARQTKLHAN